MKNYHDLLRDILTNGTRKKNRTGIDTIMLPGAMLKFDLREGFPAITTKKLAFKGVIGELIGFLRGATNVKEFQALDCIVWNQNAYSDYWLDNPAHSGVDGDLGRIYGVQWRNFGGVDQIARALELVRNDPDNRRIIVNAWNPPELDKAALPPCHVLFQLLPNAEDKTLHMTMYMRSADMFLGVPFNIASYALLLELFAEWTGYKAATLTMFLSDAHIYVNHLDQVNEQLTREPLPLPRLVIDSPIAVKYMAIDEILAHLEPKDIHLVGYQHHSPLPAPMAV